MTYRDPIITQLENRICQEKNKNAILEEELVQLKRLFSKELNSLFPQPEKIIKPSSLLLWIKCKLLNSHNLKVQLDKTIDRRAFLINRNEIFRQSIISCVDCGKIEKAKYAARKDISFLAILVFEEFYHDFDLEQQIEQYSASSKGKNDE